ncbi:MAG: flippase-like domain-containing protein [Ruminococcus sp.]|nr:flippase-like domain-containing protein [Ruminococcus sp.]
MVFRIFFGNREIGDIIEDVKRADTRWTVLGLFVIVAFVCCESWIFHYMLRIYKIRVSMFRCIRYSFIGFFFSCITPSASGGQPMQIVYMKRDGIKIGYSTLITWIVTICYKSALVILGTVFLIFKRDYCEAALGDWRWLLILGYVLNVGLLAGMIFVLFKPLYARTLGIKIVNLLTAIKLIKNSEKYIMKVSRITKNYSIGADYVKKNFRVVVNVMLISFLQRVLLSSITFIVYKAFGLSGESFFTIIAVQTVIGIMVEMMPLPGAAGISEACFMVLFEGIFGCQLKSAMLLSRGISFYALLIISGVITLVCHIFAKRHPITEEDFDVKQAEEKK